MPTGEDVDPVVRNYTISTASSDGCYHLSIKREGVASSLLHDRCDIGTITEARAPSGAFTLQCDSGRPSVLLAPALA